MNYTIGCKCNASGGIMEKKRVKKIKGAEDRRERRFGTRESES